jgi:murein tripeptide amidase MpaA
VLEGYLREILSDSQEACILRDMFVFYVVPMLNPDGVIAGNFRTSYIGKDLNRQFSKLNKYLFPEITALCQFCQNLRKSYLRGI